MIFNEGHISFNFSANWLVEKYDKTAQHLEKLQPHLDSKAVDFIGINHKVVLFLEIKDYRGNRIENKEKFGGELATAVAKKIRDSVAGGVGLTRLGGGKELWKNLAPKLAKSSDVILAILFLAQDSVVGQMAYRQKASLSIETKLLKQRLEWLNCKVLIVDFDTYGSSIPDLNISNLPGAAGHAARAAGTTP